MSGMTSRLSGSTAPDTVRTIRPFALAAGFLLAAIAAGLLLRRLDVRAGHASESSRRAVDPVFGDWFALGSGCRARASESGDVVATVLPTLRTDPSRHAMRFDLPAFHLSVDSAAAEPVGVSECAIRLAVTPPSGSRIHDVRARTRILARRGTDSDLQINEQLRLGSDSIGAANLTYRAGSGRRSVEQDVNLGTDLADGVRPPQTECGAAKLVAYDFTWATRRGPSGEPVRVDLGGSKTLDVEVVFAPCARP